MTSTKKFWICFVLAAIAAIGATTLATGSLAFPPVYIVDAFAPIIGPNYPLDTCPGAGGQPNFCDEKTYVTPIIHGYLVVGAWSQDTPVQGQQTGIEFDTVPVSNPPPASQYVTTVMDQIITNLRARNNCGSAFGTGANCSVNLNMGPNTSGVSSNQNTPLYIYDLPWAITAALGNPWTSGKQYIFRQTVCFPCGGSPSYWQLTSLVCTPAGIIGPSLDGCGWNGPLANPPLQDASFGPNYSGSGAGTVGNPNPPTTTVAKVGDNTCTLANSSPTPCTDLTIETGFALCFETPCLTAYKNFLAYIIPHFCSQLGNQSDYLRFMSLGTTGENFPQNWSQLNGITGSGPNSQTVWVAAVTDIANYEINLAKSAGCQMGFEGGINGGGATAVPASVADALAAMFSSLPASTGYSVGFANQGEQSSDPTNFAAGNSCSNDWCTNVLAYSSKISFLEVQPVGVPDSTNVNQTGDLGNFIGFFSLMRGQAPLYNEIQSKALMCAADPNYADASTCPSGTAPLARWYNLISQTSQGIPAPTIYGLYKPH